MLNFWQSYFLNMYISVNNRMESVVFYCKFVANKQLTVIILKKTGKNDREGDSSLCLLCDKN